MCILWHDIVDFIGIVACATLNRVCTLRYENLDDTVRMIIIILIINSGPHFYDFPLYLYIPTLLSAGFLVQKQKVKVVPVSLKHWKVKFI